MAVIYVLEPEAISRNVLHYRSAAGTFGLSGIAGSLDPTLVKEVSRLSGALLIILLGAVLIAAWRWKEPGKRGIVSVTALVLRVHPADVRQPGLDRFRPGGHGILDPSPDLPTDVRELVGAACGSGTGASSGTTRQGLATRHSGEECSGRLPASDLVAPATEPV